MSFSAGVKNELCRIDIQESCCLLAELAGVILVGGVYEDGPDKKGSNIRIITENASFARRVFSIIKKLYDIHPEIMIRKNNKFKKHVSYILIITSAFGGSRILRDLDRVINEFDIESNSETSFESDDTLKSSCCKRALLRGAFLAGGSISDPEKNYHLEITSHSNKTALLICRVAFWFELNAKIVERKGNFVIYLKEGENLVDFLNIIGAHSALLELENVRILKGMRNDVNRIVNCETANLEKTVNASVRQIENIKYIEEHMGFDNLSDSLREIAELRLKYCDANLKELGEYLCPPVGKSGVNHRLRKLEMIAEDLRRMKGDC
ncbi:MAG TPA: DNA-binding protein WhiA [Pseudobacteroides sp.]|uniref:DNA-binding protein WhiA n=1 Tax=Pseudobacteroides sp. TaxID=1968840 RepID=UPI002F942A57